LKLVQDRKKGARFDLAPFLFVIGLFRQLQLFVITLYLQGDLDWLLVTIAPEPAMIAIKGSS
jgi:voltage-gated potassium channel Kch